MAPPEHRVPLSTVTDLIQVGVPLPCRVLDPQQRLLLNIGQVIGSEHQREVLIERGAWVEHQWVDEERRRRGAAAPAGYVPEKARPTLFDRWEHALWELDALLHQTAKGGVTAETWAARVDAVIALVERDADVALFHVVRQEDRRFALYPPAHALYAAVLCLLAARQAGWPLERQHGMVGAALSMNVSMLELQAHLAEQADPPTQRQREQVRAHPVQSVKLLSAAGVTDAAWLRAVLQHHERVDGSGYPSATTEPCDEARLLRMADVYLAKITPRAGRVPLVAQVAARQLFQQEAGAPLAAALIKAIGVHPPGCLVQLKSGEVAVVKRRGTAGPAPTVCTLSDRNGKPSTHSHAVDCADAEHGIVGPCLDASHFARVPPERVYGLMDG